MSPHHLPVTVTRTLSRTNHHCPNSTHFSLRITRNHYLFSHLFTPSFPTKLHNLPLPLFIFSLVCNTTSTMASLQLRYLLSPPSLNFPSQHSSKPRFSRSFPPHFPGNLRAFSLAWRKQRRKRVFSTCCSSKTGSQVEKISVQEDDERPPFDINLAVILAGFAFEAYTTPPVCCFLENLVFCVWEYEQVYQEFNLLFFLWEVYLLLVKWIYKEEKREVIDMICVRGKR